MTSSLDILQPFLNEGAAAVDALVDARWAEAAVEHDRIVAARDARIAELEAQLAPFLKPRLLVGGATGGNGAPIAPFACRRTYWDNKKTAAALATAANDMEAGRVPLLSFKVGDWAAAAGGAVDTWAKTLAGQLHVLAAEQYGVPVRLAIHHEPEGDGDLKQWTAMQQRLAPFFDLPGVQFGICTTGWHQVNPEAKKVSGWDIIWPVGAPIKFFAVDVYQSDPKANGTSTDLNKAYWSRVQAESVKRGIPWSVWETGVSDKGFAAQPDWFEKQVATLSGYDCLDFAYFNSALNSQNTWRLAPGSAKEAAFLKVLA